MASVWMILGLIIATVSVSVLGATFSVVGLGALFSGAVLAVWAMAASLEFAKFVLAAYLHQRRSQMNLLLRIYLVSAVVVLSAITSMGIFGFLSNAYQSASAVLEGENIKLEALKVQQSHNSAEVSRLVKAIDEIPANRVTKRIKARAEAEPTIAALTGQTKQIESQIAESNLRILDVKQKVGPLIYIARAFQMDIDAVVKYLILVFVSVFDPLAICLVIATSEALESRKKHKAGAGLQPQQTQDQPIASSSSSPVPTAASPSPTSAPASVTGDEVIQMRFAGDDKDRNAV